METAMPSNWIGEKLVKPSIMRSAMLWISGSTANSAPSVSFQSSSSSRWSMSRFHS